jgi:hypothetical protein
MSAHLLTTGHIRARLALPDGMDTLPARRAGGALPGGWSLGASTAGTSDIEITLGRPDITADTHTVHVRLPRPAAHADTLAYVTYTGLERARQRQRMATVHATAVHTPGGRAVLLLGTKGAGKTSTALALAGRGWVHAGDDLVVLGERDDGTVSVWPGKPSAAVRAPARPLASKPLRVLEPFAAGPAPLVWVVRLAVHPTLRTATLSPAVPLSVNEKLRLHELLARYISGLPTPLAGVDTVPYGPVWPLDTPALARWRTGLISRLAARRFDYLHAPDAETAADLLTREADAG